MSLEDCAVNCMTTVSTYVYDFMREKKSLYRNSGHCAVGSCAGPGEDASILARGILQPSRPAGSSQAGKHPRLLRGPLWQLWAVCLPDRGHLQGQGSCEFCFNLSEHLPWLFILTFFLVLDSKTTWLNQKQASVLVLQLIVHHLSVVCGLVKGMTLKMCMLCFVLINGLFKICFNLLCVWILTFPCLLCVACFIEVTSRNKAHGSFVFVLTVSCLFALHGPFHQGHLQGQGSWVFCFYLD